MAFQAKHLGKDNINYGGILPWVYDASAASANEAIAAVNTAGYFNDAYNDLKVGDRIRVVATDGQFEVYVNANNYDPVAGTGSVDVTDGTQISATDTD